MANNTDYTRLLDGNALKAIKAWVEGKGYKTTDNNYYPSRSYTSGLQISTSNGSTVTALYVPYMTASQYGVAKVYAVRSSAITATTGGTTSDRYYGVEKDSNGKLFVNVPWSGGGSSAYYQYQNNDKYWGYYSNYVGDYTPYGNYGAVFEGGSMEKMFIGFNSFVEYPDNNTFRDPTKQNVHITGRNITFNVAGNYNSSDYQGSIVYEHNYYYNNIHVLNGWSTYNVRFSLRGDDATRSTPTTIASICSLLYYCGHRSSATALVASGIYGSYTKPIIAIYATSYNSGLYLVYMNGTTETTVNITSGTVSASPGVYLIP